MASLPANLPKIDFEAYKKQLPNPTAIAALEKGVIKKKTLQRNKSIDLNCLKKN